MKRVAPFEALDELGDDALPSVLCKIVNAALRGG
jgi:hypothetical protein